MHTNLVCTNDYVNTEESFGAIVLFDEILADACTKLNR